MTSGPWVLALTGGSTLLFGTASLAAARRLVDDKAGHTRFLLATGGVGLLLNVLLLSLRGTQTDKPVAISTSFDMNILMSSLVVVAALVALAGGQRLRGLEGMLLPIACITQLVAWLKLGKQGTDADYQSWFIVHVAAFAVGAVCFVLSGVAGIAYLALTRVLRNKQPSPLLGKFAPLESLERFGRWGLLMGWPVFTFGILTGICEVVQSGQPGRWLTDPLVVFTFGMWLLYAVVLMGSWFRLSFRGRQSARWAAVSMALLGFTFLIVDLLSPIHR